MLAAQGSTMAWHTYRNQVGKAPNKEFGARFFNEEVLLTVSKDSTSHFRFQMTVVLSSTGCG